MLTYLWWYDLTNPIATSEYGFASHTVCDWASFCREVAIDAMIVNSKKIGGPGIIVEIDESKFGKSMFL